MMAYKYVDVPRPYSENPNAPENIAILKRKVRLFNKRKGPRVGDYIILNDGTVKRFSYRWDDGLQVSNGGSFYFEEGWCNFSGELDPTIPFEDIEPTREKRFGWVWFFSKGYPGANRGVHYQIKFRVYKQQKHGLTV